MNQARKHLRIAGLLEIIIGIATIAFTLFLLEKGNTIQGQTSASVGNDAFFALLSLYGVHVFEILCGIIAIVSTNRRSLLCVILGLILMVANLAEFFMNSTQIVEILVHALTLLVPYYYLHNAVRSFRS